MKLTLSQSCSVKKIQKKRPLVLFLNPDDFLGNVFGSGTDAANGQENVVAQEITRQNLKQEFIINLNFCF